MGEGTKNPLKYMTMVSKWDQILVGLGRKAVTEKQW